MASFKFGEVKNLPISPLGSTSFARDGNLALASLIMTILSDMTNAAAASLWSGVLIMLLGVISIRLSFVRFQRKSDIYGEDSVQLMLASRAFSNAIEYIPVSVGALILLYHLEIPVTAIHALGAMLFAGRLVQAIGLNKPDNAAITIAGMALTFLAIFAGGGMLVVFAFL